jgi:hypothetical protein
VLTFAAISPTVSLLDFSSKVTIFHLQLSCTGFAEEREPSFLIVMLTAVGRNIKPLLAKLVSGTASEPEINAVVRTAFAFASQRLRQLLKSKKLHLHSFSISTEGLAFDCIAELFQRDEDEQFVELIDYFSGDRELEKLDEEETTQQLRILVFSKVNQGLFRLYRENDPVLARLIRNIKLAIKADPSFKQLELLGQTYIFTCPEDERNDHLPENPLEGLERELIPRISPGSRIPHNVSVLFQVLNDQDGYRKFYSVIDIAVVLKRALARLESVDDQVQHFDDDLLRIEINVVLTESCRTLKERLYRKYVPAGKLTNDTFEKYWLALEEMIFNIFVLNDGSEASHPELLKNHFENLDTKTYRLVHRTHFEYMARVVKNYVRDQLRELL